MYNTLQKKKLLNVTSCPNMIQQDIKRNYFHIFRSIRSWMLKLGLSGSPKPSSFSLMINLIFNITSHEKFEMVDIAFSGTELIMNMWKVFRFNLFRWGKKIKREYVTKRSRFPRHKFTSRIFLKRPIFEILLILLYYYNCLLKLWTFLSGIATNSAKIYHPWGKRIIQ